MSDRNTTSKHGRRRRRRRNSGDRRRRSEQCPSCGRWELTTVDVDDELPIRTCSACHRSFGVDDSMDAETLSRLVDAGADVRLRIASCDCGNEDQNEFVVCGLDHDDRGGGTVLRVKCLVCGQPTTISLVGAQSPETEYLEERHNVVRAKSSSDAASVDVQRFQSGGWQRGNHADDDVFGNDHGEDRGRPTRARRFQSDSHQEHVESYIECCCGNADPNELVTAYDDYGCLTAAWCAVCQKQLATPWTDRKRSPQTDRRPEVGKRRQEVDRRRDRAEVDVKAVGLRRVLVRNLRDVCRGDHVAWPKWYVVTHHAIVVDVDPDHGRLTVIHYSGGLEKLDGHLASVRLEELDVDPSKEEMCRFEYPAHYGCLPADEALERAGSRLGEARYNPLSNNCEHFVRWCKTGRADSGQVAAFADRVRFASSLNAAPLSLPCQVEANLDGEIGLFLRDAGRARRKHAAGDMSTEDYRKRVVELGCECVGGFVGNTALGIAGRLLVPLRPEGMVIGGRLGNLVGRFLGAVVGRNVNKLRYR